MNGCFVLYPFELGETLTKRINVGVSTDNSFGCELAEDVVCMEDIPPYDVSLRDGWAISTTEGNHTLVGEPVKNGEQPALLQKNGSRWINTGGFLPLAADAVVSDSDPQAPDFAADVYPYENVLPRGTEWTKGSLILKKGTVLGAGAQALLFEAGIENIRVWKRPSAAILATGHEIAEAGALSSAGRHSSNAVYLMNLLSGLGLTDTAIFYAKDEADSIADRLEVLAQSFDLLSRSEEPDKVRAICCGLRLSAPERSSPKIRQNSRVHCLLYAQISKVRFCSAFLVIRSGSSTLFSGSCSPSFGSLSERILSL